MFEVGRCLVSIELFNWPVGWRKRRAEKGESGNETVHRDARSKVPPIEPVDWAHFRHFFIGFVEITSGLLRPGRVSGA